MNGIIIIGDSMSDKVYRNDGIANLFELESLFNIIKNLEKQIEQISNDSSLDKFERKSRIENLIQEKNFLVIRFRKGISIEKPPIVDEIKENIILFLKQYGFNPDTFIKKIDSVQFCVTNERLISGGLMSTSSNKISIDYTLAEFDENGNFLGLKVNSFIKYILTHELLHVCSMNLDEKYKNGVWSEGYTDLLAHIISKNNNDKSENYDFPVKVFTLLTNLVGIKNTIEDYFFNLKTMPHLFNLFNQCGLDENDFWNFYRILDKTMPNGNKNLEEIYNSKIDLIEKIKHYIFIPYLKGLNDNKEYYINLFNNLFNDIGVSCSYEELNNSVK